MREASINIEAFVVNEFRVCYAFIFSLVFSRCQATYSSNTTTHSTSLTTHKTQSHSITITSYRSLKYFVDKFIVTNLFVYFHSTQYNDN